ncbi:DNA mismatch repair protein MutT [Chitinophaga parva]|uniref:DNA mismatch repair protein MutT n=1 Tax=Chitinophaga parva TaxID=2169414 RepID=A0A2T7BJP0_9BACT|nr:NUDIX domain-containing protein [Chitinophaga parva]PUZ26483.1 DNA mismatch repair protein MutT [Chitinophaga parva]
MTGYTRQKHVLIAVDCIIFGFDGNSMQQLLIRRSFEPAKGKWSLMGGFVQHDEDLPVAAARILKTLTGLEGVYLEQLGAFGRPDRDPKERTVSIAYFALIDINQYKLQLSNDYQAAWFDLQETPRLIFDHDEMVKQAKDRLRYKAAIHPILFELLPARFTIPQLQQLYEAVYETTFDKRNFSRKILSTGLLVKQKEKDKETSKKGAYYYKLDKRRYQEKFHSFLNFISDPGKLK